MISKENLIYHLRILIDSFKSFPPPELDENSGTERNFKRMMK